MQLANLIDVCQLKCHHMDFTLTLTFWNMKLATACCICYFDWSVACCICVILQTQVHL